MAKTMESDDPGVKSWFYHLEAVWLWIHHLTPLSLSSFIYRIRMEKPDLHRVLVKIK